MPAWRPDACGASSSSAGSCTTTCSRRARTSTSTAWPSSAWSSYPFPLEGLAAVLARYPENAELVWAQEEPRNMGAWRFVREEFMDRAAGLANGRIPRYIGREASASPAPGSHKLHAEEQESIVEAALQIPAATETQLVTQHAAPATS